MCAVRDERGKKKRQDMSQEDTRDVLEVTETD